MMITQIDDDQKGEYLQILYDRDHHFSRKITVGFAKSIRLIYQGLRAKQTPGERRLPRIDMRVSLDSPEAGSVRLVNFNYRYVMLEHDASLPDRLTLYINDDISIECKKDEELNALRRDDSSLYEILDWQALSANKAYRDSVIKIA